MPFRLKIIHMLACVGHQHEYRVSEKKLCKEKVPLFDVNKSSCDIKTYSQDVTNEVLAFECRLFQQFGCSNPEKYYMVLLIN